MTLPDKFKFRIKDFTPTTYTAEVRDRGFSYLVSWPTPYGVSYEYHEAASVMGMVQSGSWTILGESFPDISKPAAALDILINERKDASELTVHEMMALRLTRGLINRLLDAR